MFISNHYYHIQYRGACSRYTNETFVKNFSKSFISNLLISSSKPVNWQSLSAKPAACFGFEYRIVYECYTNRLIY